MSLADPKLQADIIDAAIALGEVNGTDGITMRGLASRLNISATQIYQHFDSKRSILDELRLQASIEMLEHIVVGLEEDDPRTATIRVARRYVEWGLANPWRYPLLMENDTIGDADLSRRPARALRRVQSRRGRSDRAAHRRPQIPTDDLARHFARWWAWLHGTISLVLNNRIRATHPAAPVTDVPLFITESVTAATDTLLRALQPEKAT